MPAAVVGLGELMLRLSPPSPERIEQASTLHIYPAGAEANVIAALARLGISAALITALPDSPLGHRAAGELAAVGADLSFVQWLSGARMGTFFVELGGGARPTSVCYDRAHSAFAEHIRWHLGALENAQFAVVSGVTPALGELPRGATAALAREARMRGVPLCVDVNYRALLWSAAEARDELALLLADADVVVCAAHDAVTLFELEGGDPVALQQQYAPRASVCVITDGERGCVACSRDHERVSVPALSTTVVDRLGIGDAFVAGLLYGLLGHQPLRDALTAANALAALKATVKGDFSLARKSDLDAAISQSAPRGILR